MSVLRPRLEKIVALYGQALVAATHERTHNASITSCDLVLQFADADPTPGKSRTQWMIQTYIKDKDFKLEDLGRMHAALTAFERMKRKLSVEQREIGHLTSLYALETLVEPLVAAETNARLERDLSSMTGRELRRVEEWKARDESIIIQEGDSLPTIVVPLTEFASQWWGRGTRWCTAADHKNVFHQYNKIAPLFVFIDTNGEKFQLYINGEDIQFSDATDKQINILIIRQRWSSMKTLLTWAIEQNGNMLNWIPEQERTPDLCRIAVAQKGSALKYVPEIYRTPGLYQVAIENDGMMLGCLPPEKRTIDICRLALNNNGDALHYVPMVFRTAEICLLAVKNNGLALQFVPEKRKVFALYNIAVHRNGEALRYIPENQRTLDLCKMAVAQSGLALEHVPQKYITSAFYHLAVQQNGEALGDVPYYGRTLELCQIAVAQNGLAIRCVPERYKTLELCQLAVKQRDEAFYAIPLEFQEQLRSCRQSFFPQWGMSSLDTFKDYCTRTV
jgi:hypothetical protein